MDHRKGLLPAFLARLGRMGGSYSTVVTSRTVEEERKRERRHVERTVARSPLSRDAYFVDRHGTVHRRMAKRDKSISARQYKRKIKRQRREARGAERGTGKV